MEIKINSEEIKKINNNGFDILFSIYNDFSLCEQYIPKWISQKESILINLSYFKYVYIYMLLIIIFIIRFINDDFIIYFYNFQKF